MAITTDTLCQRCGEGPPVARVTSEYVNILVCQACALEAKRVDVKQRYLRVAYLAQAEGKEGT